MSEIRKRYEYLQADEFHFNHVRFFPVDSDIADVWIPYLAEYDSGSDLPGFFCPVAGDRFLGQGNLIEQIKGIGKGFTDGRTSRILYGLDLDAVESEALETRVAIKFMKPEYNQFNTDVFSYPLYFFQEGEIAIGLHHPNLVEVRDSAVELVEGEYIPGYIMEYLTMLEGKVSLYNLRLLLRQIAPAIDYMHKQGVAHRDIQPGNIGMRTLRTGEVQYVLSDFGAADYCEGDEASTRECGIPYADPQQLARMDFHLRDKADVHAFGISVFNFLSMIPHPYGMEGHTDESQRMDELYCPALGPQQRAAIEEILHIATAYNREKRFATCGEMVDALLPFLVHDDPEQDLIPLK